MDQSSPVIKILLTDDDSDDILLFREVLAELPFRTELATVYNGEQLMNLLLRGPDNLPDILFLDLNMPRKNGYECLVEIKKNETLNKLPVVIFSTACDPEIIKQLYRHGVYSFFRKPNKFEELKKLVHDILKDFGANRAVLFPHESADK